MTPWTCTHCQTEQTTDTICQSCERPRFTSSAVQIAEHILEHLADGCVDQLDVLKAMNARSCYARINGGHGFSLSFIAQQIRLLTKDTTAMAREVARARSARLMLEVCETGDSKDKLAVLTKWGPDTNTERVDHSGNVTSTLVIETNSGPPPKQNG